MVAVSCWASSVGERNARTDKDRRRLRDMGLLYDNETLSLCFGDVKTRSVGGRFSSVFPLDIDSNLPYAQSNFIYRGELICRSIRRALFGRFFLYFWRLNQPRSRSRAW